MPAAPRWRPTRLPPAGHAMALRAWRALHERATATDTASGATTALSARLGGRPVGLYASGRAALVALLAHLHAATGRDEVVLPAYCCYSVAAAAVAAGLSVRLVDVDDRGRVDAAALERLPLERACAVLVANLFGLVEPIEAVVEIAGRSGCAVVDDAAQSLGARDESGPAGARGDAGVLSFGRGKPVCALGGGALVGSAEGAGTPPAPSLPIPRPGAALARALAWDVASRAAVFRMLAAIPALHIGETIFDPEIDVAAIPGAALSLLGPALAELEADAEGRRSVARDLAERLAAGSPWRPLLAARPEGGVYPRLALLAPDETTRDRALARLTRIGAGASALYPASLDGVPGLVGHLADPAPQPRARALAARVVTLPTHGRLGGARLRAALTILGVCSRGAGAPGTPA